VSFDAFSCAASSGAFVTDYSSYEMILVIEVLHENQFYSDKTFLTVLLMESIKVK
jgi:hypothetical protein